MARPESRVAESEAAERRNGIMAYLEGPNSERPEEILASYNVRLAMSASRSRE
jgi:hypothetical protein